jgi:hypothetical protein
LPKDEFVGNNNWPPLIYVREGRRLVGEYVYSEKMVNRKKAVLVPRRLKMLLQFEITVLIVMAPFLPVDVKNGN